MSDKKRRREDDDFAAPLSKRINNLHLTQSSQQVPPPPQHIPHHHATNGYLHPHSSVTSHNSSSNSSSAHDDHVMDFEPYNPELTEEENPLYYRKNKLLYELHMERKGRHPSVLFISSSGSAKGMASTGARRLTQKLFVGELPLSAGRIELREYFAQFGRVFRSEVIFSKTTGISKRYGFIAVDQNGYENLRKQNTHRIDGQRIVVQPQNE